MVTIQSPYSELYLGLQEREFYRSRSSTYFVALTGPATNESSQYLDKRLFVQLNGSRKVIGVLRGYDVRSRPERETHFG